MGQQGSHILGRIIRLQVGRLTRQHGIRRTVAFVEAVPRKLLEQIENPQRLRTGNLIRLRAPQYKGLPLLRHLLRLLLAHRPTKQIRLS